MEPPQVTEGCLGDVQYVVYFLADMDGIIGCWPAL